MQSSPASAKSQQLARLLDTAIMKSGVAALDDVPPDQASALAALLTKPFFVGSNPYSNLRATWAADSLLQVSSDLTLAMLVSRSTALKLLAAEGTLNVPATRGCRSPTAASRTWW